MHNFLPGCLHLPFVTRCTFKSIIAIAAILVLLAATGTYIFQSQVSKAGAAISKSADVQTDSTSGAPATDVITAVSRPMMVAPPVFYRRELHEEVAPVPAVFISSTQAVRPPPSLL